MLGLCSRNHGIPRITPTLSSGTTLNYTSWATPLPNETHARTNCVLYTTIPVARRMGRRLLSVYVRPAVSTVRLAIKLCVAPESINAVQLVPPNATCSSNKAPPLVLKLPSVKVTAPNASSSSTPPGLSAAPSPRFLTRSPDRLRQHEGCLGGDTHACSAPPAHTSST